MDVKAFRELPIMGILRGLDEAMVAPIVEIVDSSGLRTLEVTMNTPKAPLLIQDLVKRIGGRVNVGAGTVLTLDDLHMALDAGASFIVLPGLVLEVVEYCAENEVPVFPGGLSPTEIYNAWQAGAAMVKVFPASCFGPAYFKELKGPFEEVELLACGGVTAENIRSFFDCGASGVAFGSSIFQVEMLRNRKYSQIGKPLKKLILNYLEWRDEQTRASRPGGQ
jgi:2-dehydro-3-deoxyphosphogluconate aldolase/(4S)-4-hydroxy-2-oxoglutarate aldolase